MLILISCIHKIERASAVFKLTAGSFYFPSSIKEPYLQLSVRLEQW